MQNHLIIDVTGKNTLLKWFKKIPGGIGILSNGTHSVKKNNAKKIIEVKDATYAVVKRML